MGLPDPAADRASSIAADIRAADDPATALYGLTEAFDYGLAGALERQVWMRYPDEVADDGERTCYEDAVFVYAVADALDLDPRFFKAGIQGGHGMVDVELDGERVVIDENYGLCGPVDFYDDGEIVLDESRVDGKTRETYDWIREVHEDELLDEISNLRENPAGMLADGQRVATHDLDGDTVYDKLIFDEDERVLERRVDVRSNRGPYSPLIRVRHAFDGSGAVVDTETVYTDTEGSNRNQIWGEIRIGADHGDGIVFEDAFPGTFSSHVAAFVGYAEARDGDGLVHDTDALEGFWQRLQEEQDALLEGHTGFQGRRLRNRLDRLQGYADDDRERLLQELDWWLFRADAGIPDETADILPAYVERHREALDLVREQDDAAVAAAIAGVSDYLASRDDTDALVDTVREAGLANVYDDLADAATADDPTTVTAFRDVVLTTPTLHDPLLGQGDDRLQDLLREMAVGFERAAYEGEQRWRYDRDDRELRHVLTLEDHNLSYYDSRVTVSYRFDAAGELDETRLRIEDTVPEIDDGYVLFDQAIDSIGDVSISDLQDAAAERIDDLMEKPVLAAPTPHRDADFLAKNAPAIGFYSCIGFDEDDDAPDLIVDDGDLDAFFDQLLDELSYAADADHLSQDDQQRAATDVDDMREIRDSDEYEQVAALNWVRSHVLNGETEVVQKAVDDTFIPEEQARQYMKKFADAFNQVYWTDDFEDESAEMRDRVASGIERTVPDAGTVEAFATGHGYEDLNAANRVLDARRPWAEKGPEMKRLLDDAPARLTDVETAYERQAVMDTLRSFEHRLVQRDRYHDWAEDADADLVDTVASLKEQVADTPPTVTLDEEDTAALLEALQHG